MPSSFATGTLSLFKASITAAIHESFGPGNELEQHSLSSPCGISHRRIRTTDRSAVPRPENRLDREEALPTPSALPASDDSLFGVGSLDHPELERATASTPDSPGGPKLKGLGLSGGVLLCRLVGLVSGRTRTQHGHPAAPRPPETSSAPPL